MSEEIIIDGVNVAECDAYKDKHCMDKTSIMFCNLNTCSNFPNCYYKQFKRLQAENKELKHRCEVYHQCDEMIKNTYGQAHKKAMELTKENEQLKEENKKIKKRLERYKKANERLYDMQVDDFNFTKTKYKQALEEIMEIVKRNEWIYQGLLPNHIYENTMQIQIKISEVLDEQ